jgi:simple sugar transport system permease protein
MRSARQQEIMVALGLLAGALVVSLLVFGVFVAGSGVNPFTAYTLMYMGGFGTWFSWQNTLQRAAPLILTALCTAIPAHLGLVIIGGEGALVLGGLGAVGVALHLPGGTPWLVQLAMALAGMMAGGLLILVAGALRHYRGVNETISSLLLTYIAIAVFNHLVEGPMRDPASLNKPSTAALNEAHMLGMVPGMEVHWGLVYGLLACVAVYVLMCVRCLVLPRVWPAAMPVRRSSPACRSAVSSLRDVSWPVLLLGWLVWSRCLPCTAAPMPRWPWAMAIRVSW